MPEARIWKFWNYGYKGGCLEIMTIKLKIRFRFFQKIDNSMYPNMNKINKIKYCQGVIHL